MISMASREMDRASRGERVGLVEMFMECLLYHFPRTGDMESDSQSLTTREAPKIGTPLRYCCVLHLWMREEPDVILNASTIRLSDKSISSGDRDKVAGA